MSSENAVVSAVDAAVDSGSDAGVDPVGSFVVGVSSSRITCSALQRP